MTAVRISLAHVAMLAYLAAVTAGCGHDQPRGIVERAGGAEALREAALAVKSYAPRDGTEVLVPREVWPEPFRRLSPEAVLVDTEGVDVTLNVDTFYASGLRLPFDVSGTPKDLGEDLSFEQIVPGVYWYRMLMGG